MATLKQKSALHTMIKNGGNASKAMVEVGYSPNTAKTPQKLTESLGFKELCNDYGLTDSFLLKALVNDIEDKPKNRKAELELAFRIKGHLDRVEGDVTRPVNIVIPIQVSQAFNIKEDGINNETIRSDTEQS